MDAPKSDVDRGREKSSTDFQVLLTCSTAGTPLDDRVLWCTLFTSVDSILRSQAQSERAHTEEEKSLIASLLFEIAGDDDLAKMANEGLRSMQRRFLEPKARQIELEIATKGADLDSELPSLLKQRAEIIRQLQHPPKLTLDS